MSGRLIIVDNNPFVKECFDFLRFHTEAWDIPASTEAARRHWSTMTFASPNVARAIPRNDLKFLTLATLDSVASKDRSRSTGGIT